MRAPFASLLVVGVVSACGSSSGDGGAVPDEGTGGTTVIAGAGGASGASSSKGGAGGAGAKAGAAGKGGGASGKSGATSAGGASTGGAGGKGGAGGTTGKGGSSGGAAGTSSTGAGGSNPNDPFDKARQLCVDTINMYRATLNLTPYKRWADNEACVDKEASGDGMANMAHMSFKNHLCSPAYAQDECPGYGPDPISALPGCLQQMWEEKNRPQCTGCNNCDFPYQNCVNCTFFGTNGTDGCGHYLNMKSGAFSEVACGFWSGGWYAQDFQ